ncbi:uncharacterized protein M6B38_256500 [Iris pallida]|uniref:VTT domain-containing protein n=1 Tax=Iris pallida TaxID=29817 RepID=A0AAX6HNY6_IRIPA|nr:uncharacterized protein M6B38_298540 [Iris pallida]KAJ6852092.1 uncharacterized protein M6B38_256500 [Iris pallida]
MAFKDPPIGEEGKMGFGDGNGDYATLRGSSDDPELGNYVKVWSSRKWSNLRWWIKVIVFCVFLLAGAAVVAIFLVPLLMKKVVIPILNWERTTFSIPVLGLLLFASIAFFPAMLLPSAPSMWIAGMTFGYGYGFLLIMGAAIIGMSLPFFIGSLFQHKIHKWLERWPKKAAIVRLAGEGDWFHQFRAVALLRISPFPYLIFNYAAVATSVKYYPYICGSIAGTVIEIFMTIYSGRMIMTLADATDAGGFLSVEQILYDALGFGTAMAATAAITTYAKRALQTLQVEDELS